MLRLVRLFLLKALGARKIVRLTDVVRGKTVSPTTQNVLQIVAVVTGYFIPPTIVLLVVRKSRLREFFVLTVYIALWLVLANWSGLFSRSISN